MVQAVITPDKLKFELDKLVCGQDYAKIVFSVGVYRHLLRISKPDAGFEKSNILVVGPTGSGKTEIMRSLKKILDKFNIDVPVLIADGSSFTECGVRGSDPQEILVRLIKTYGIEKAQRAIVFIDEFDKKCSKRNNKPKNSADQYAILKMIEGTVVDMSEYSDSGVESIDTSNILFVLGGAFTGIDSIVAARMGQKSSNKVRRAPNVLEISQKVVPCSHQTKDYNSVIDHVEPIDFLNFGVMREVLGRLPSVAVLKSLSIQDFEKIALNYYKNEYENIFEKEGIYVEFSPDAIQTIAEEAEKKHLGARAIKAVLEPLLLDLLFEKVNPSLRKTRQTVKITKSDVLKYQQHGAAC